MRIVDVVHAAAPRCYANYVKAFDAGDVLFQQAQINTALRIGHFLAQVLYETGRGTVLFENLNYTTPERLMQIFGVGHHSAAIRQQRRLMLPMP
jgi:putative chitinase